MILSFYCFVLERKRRLLLPFLTLLLSINVFSAFAQQVNVTGQVKDESGEGIPGVNVLLKNKEAGTATDFEGKFSLVADRNDILQFTSVGYVTQEVTVGNQTSFNIVLAADVEQLEEVVVTALGISKSEKSLGYAVANIKSEELTKVSNPNFASALYGKAPGVQIKTAPGGAAAAVDINIRGINSISGSSQPLIVMDGIPIRNEEANNAGYWGDQKIRGNGLVDINPEDIANISILKGAAASALYGSEGANGVVVITTKSGNSSKKGFGVEASMSMSFDRAAYFPNLQTEYGPGYDRKSNMTNYGANEEGFIPYGSAGKVRVPFEAAGQFGPRFDGRTVTNWLGNEVPYVSQGNNWKDMFNPGSTRNFNVALTKSTDAINMRLSLSQLKAQDVNISGPFEKYTASLNTSVKISPKNKLNFVFTDVYQKVNNRPEKISRITNNYGGFFSRFDDIDWYKDNYTTSAGYKYVIGKDQPSATPEENIPFSFRAKDFMEYFWRNNEIQEDETSNRIIASITDTHEFIKGLNLRGRFGIDMTSFTSQRMEPNSAPISIRNSGSFSQATSFKSILYGDIVLTYDKMFADKYGINLSAGLTGRETVNKRNSMNTSGGLSAENWFHINASVNQRGGSSTEWRQASYAYFGTAEFNYNHFLFLNFSGRYENFSSLPENSRGTFYPAGSLSMVFNEAIEMPSWVDFSKLRVSYGEVGVPAPVYKSNIAYNQGGLNGTIYSALGAGYGNESIVPERKKEFEIGLEHKFFGNRLGFEFTYYNSTIEDQILTLNVPPTVGYSTMLANVGKLKNYGYEIALSGTPIQTNDFSWDVSAVLSFNRNEVVELMEGVDELEHRNVDGGAAWLVSKVGQPMGDFVTFLPKKDEQGRLIVDNDGYPMMDFENKHTEGNVNPDVIGGLQNSFRYKGFTLDAGIDFRFGGQIMSLGQYYMYGMGMYEETLKYRSKSEGGLSYNIDDKGNFILAEGGKYDDGLIIDGVTQEGKKNEKVIDAANYYMKMYAWGGPQYNSYSNYSSSILDNSYIKLRELSLSYDLPKNIVKNIGLSSVRVGVFGRNLFYIYKTLDHSDPEATLGTNWISKAFDAGSASSTRSFGFNVRVKL
ncbi:SusC/RagA family TonB-linked outer membrane protein [Fulvitalea axinellae]|uniref:SusC/RagA family TonB-linked outer membrane protein n=1 Tax=Fulvitalea axinellae TaxID=1182444 RepID=A0AAU9D984_9BACT|nr:SusC/RagA family TonB-linked outer membrane protein [Fulvitalea axinellae]